MMTFQLLKKSRKKKKRLFFLLSECFAAIFVYFVYYNVNILPCNRLKFSHRKLILLTSVIFVVFLCDQFT
uniref:Uncharacterized protein n=1 Tax=Anguilla anguilla TaxID=7936 RepID=A0A0E9X2I5_ANGAN